MHQFRSSAGLLAIYSVRSFHRFISLFYPTESAFESSAPDCCRSAATEVARRATLDSDEGSDTQREAFLAAVWLSFGEAAR